MGIRETLNRNPAITGGATALILIIALIFIFKSCGSEDAPGIIVTKSFYTEDDGKTFFIDDANKIVPYKNASGKEVVRAHVYTCEGKQFVGYMEKLSEASRKRLEASLADPKNSGRHIARVELEEGGRMLKKPGQRVWVTFEKNPDLAGKVQEVKCSNGAAAEEVIAGR